MKTSAFIFPIVFSMGGHAQAQGLWTHAMVQVRAGSCTNSRAALVAYGFMARTGISVASDCFLASGNEYLRLTKLDSTPFAQGFVLALWEHTSFKVKVQDSITSTYNVPHMNADGAVEASAYTITRQILREETKSFPDNLALCEQGLALALQPGVTTAMPNASGLTSPVAGYCHTDGSGVIRAQLFYSIL